MTDKPTKHSVWATEVRAPFKKVVAFDILFWGLGAITGAGISTAVLFNR
ncbi:MAG: hypothetical protein KGH87_00325 [Thaumarchaeota archaeon]|nr:hypothetical protein [Nitrososphaerota archaeon]MDE1838341.1 hypothetical protein [Nitrososphaerota archaeon]